MMKRRQNFQTISWFWDLYQRNLLNLDPRYQRRSVWNQEFKDYFIETVLLGYPSPAIFLYEEIEPSGVSKFNVVDGKQRLTTVFEFVKNDFPIYDKSEIESLRGKYFRQLDDEKKVELWNYPFLVEYIPTKEENIINNIFDRINRNVAKLTFQELRHARLSGVFIKTSEELTELIKAELPPNFPRFDPQSRRQMKDVELTAQLLLLLEEGPRGYSQEELDKAFTERDINWEEKEEYESLFKDVINKLKEIIEATENGNLAKTRFRNQADFYSLFGAISLLIKNGVLPSSGEIAQRLQSFLATLENESTRTESKRVNDYYNAVSKSTSDTGPRKNRIEIIKDVIIGELM